MAISTHISEDHLQFFVWTAGEDASNTTSKYQHLNEQKLKFERSGLETHFKAMKLDKFTFLASPTKLKLFENQLATCDKKANIIVIDDRVDNLDEAVKILQQNGFSHYKTILISDEAKVKEHIICTNVIHSLRHIEQPSKTILFCDMDGVLIHEEFRNEHQLRNLYMALNQHKKLEAGLDIYSQRQSPLKINYSKIDQTQPTKQVITLGISSPQDLSNTQLISVCEKSFKIIPRVITERGRVTRREGNQYVNEYSFIKLINEEELIEYSFTKLGYRGTLFSDVNKALRSHLPCVFIVDIDTALLMTKVFSAQGITNRSILITPEKKSERMAINYKKDMFDYVIGKDYQKIAQVISTIIEGGV